MTKFADRTGLSVAFDATSQCPEAEVSSVEIPTVGTGDLRRVEMIICLARFLRGLQVGP